MSFDFEIVHRAGKQNIADYMSRNPIGSPPRQDEVGEAYINAMADYSTPKAMTRTEIVAATDEDAVLVATRKAIRNEVMSGEES